MHTIISTRECYEAFNNKENAWVIGNGFTEEEGFDMDSISWSETGWSDEKSYFMEYLDDQIKAYEKRYKTTVQKIALVGHVGRWNGSFVGGRMLETDDNPLEKMGDVDDVEVSVLENNMIQVSGHHHDATHRMNIYFLTENKLNQVDKDWNSSYFDFDYSHFEFIYENFKPLALTKRGRSYFNPTAEAVAS